MNIQIKDLTFKFINKPLFENFNYKITEANLTLIQGPSGCGKSTFLKLLAGLIRPQHGEIHFSVAKPKIGYLHQDLHLIEHWSIKENLNLADRSSIHQNKWLRDFDLMMNPNSIVRKLSGGEKQRVSLVRIILSDSDFILLDEPTAHLDDLHTDVVLKAIKNEFHKKTIIIVSHDQRVKKYSDQTLNWEKELSYGV